MRRSDRPIVPAGTPDGRHRSGPRRAARLGAVAAAAAVLGAGLASASAFSPDQGGAASADGYWPEQAEPRSFLVADALHRPSADDATKSAKSAKKSAKSVRQEAVRGVAVRAPAQAAPAVVPPPRPAEVQAPPRATPTPFPTATPVERITGAEARRLLDAGALSPAQAAALAALVGGGTTGDDLRRLTTAEAADVLAASGAPATRVREILGGGLREPGSPTATPPVAPAPRSVGVLGRLFAFVASLLGR